MAIRVDASGEHLSRTTDLFDHESNYTIMGWFQLVADRNDYGHFIVVTDNAGNYDHVGVDSDGTTLRAEVISTSATGTALSVGTWYHITLRRESDSVLRVLLNGTQDITVTQSVTGRPAPTILRLMDIPDFSGYWTNGRCAGLKAWTTNLTDAEVQNEMRRLRPVRTADLYAWWPILSGGNRALDYSGNGRNWTETGTLTDEDGPPVSWGASTAFLESKNPEYKIAWIIA